MLTLEDLKDSSLRRILEGEDLKKYQDLMDFDKKLLALFIKVVEEFSLPKERTPESQEKWYRLNFTKSEQTAIRFMVDWQNEILKALVNVSQSGKLITTSMPNKSSLKKIFESEREWHELMISLYINEAYKFICRIENYLNAFGNRLKSKKVTKEAESTLKSIIIASKKLLKKSVDHRVHVRGIDVHSIRYQDKTLDNLELYEHALRLQIGGESEIWKHQKWIKEHRREFKRNWKAIIKKDKADFLRLLDNLSWVFRLAIHRISPRFESILDWDEFNKRFPQKT